MGGASLVRAVRPDRSIDLASHGPGSPSKYHSESPEPAHLLLNAVFTSVKQIRRDHQV